MSPGTRDWRKICEELLRERDAERSAVLMEELLAVLDARVEKHDEQPPSSLRPS
jgi:hypothetical protein